MVHDLKRNICANIIGTLKYLSAETEQLDYKSKVPFVHVPEELLSQWDSYRIYFYESGWFLQWLDPICIDALVCFDEQIKKFRKSHKEIEDVPNVFNNKDWNRLGHLSRDLLHVVLQYVNFEEDPNKENAAD